MGTHPGTHFVPLSSPMGGRGSFMAGLGLPDGDQMLRDSQIAPKARPRMFLERILSVVAPFCLLFL